MSEQFDPVNKPKQYNKNKCGIQTIEVTRYLGCDLGNAWKYMSRYLFKKNPKEDYTTGPPPRTTPRPLAAWPSCAGWCATAAAVCR